jgi:putative transcriptional regulator
MKKRAKKFVPKYPGERSLTEAEIVAAAESDPDALPLTKSALAKLRRVPAVKRLRWELGLTQQAFAERYGIPLGTLRDWEQGRAEPDATARTYLKVIKADPKKVAKIYEAA